MKKISHINYEAFLLDYAEGNLSAENTADLLLFLEQNPDLKVDLESLSEAIVSPDSSVNAGFKRTLYKTKSHIESRFNALAISWYDQSISEQEKQELEQLFLQFPELVNAFSAFENTFLKPDFSVDFDNKLTLKKEFYVVSDFEHQAISELEGLLTPNESESFHSVVKVSLPLTLEWEAFKKAYLENEHIPFDSKHLLYKGIAVNPTSVIRKRALAVAASLLLLAGLFTMLNYSGDSSDIRTTQLIGDSVNRTKTNPTDSVIQNKKPFQLLPNPIKIQESPLQKSKPIDSFTNAPIEENFVIRQQFAELKSIPALIKGPFELETTFLSQLTPETQQLDSPSLQNSKSGSLTIGQFLENKMRRAALKWGFDVPTAIQKENLAKNGMKELEELTNGIVSITHDETPEGRKISGFSIGSVAIRRSTGNN
jgi:hypothetical protein